MSKATKAAQDIAQLSQAYESLVRANRGLDEFIRGVRSSNNAWNAWAANRDPAAVQVEGAIYVQAVREMVAAKVAGLDEALARVATGGMLPALPSLETILFPEGTPQDPVIPIEPINEQEPSPDPSPEPPTEPVMASPKSRRSR